MKAIELYAEWRPKPGFKLGKKDIDGKLTYLGSLVWKNPVVRAAERKIPELIDDDDVIVKVKACGICGSDVHMAQASEDGYIYYPGLTAFPVVLGHEFSGEVVKAGKNALNKRNNKVFTPGEAICVEEMFWCGQCRPCCDGYPNNCENLQELGFSIDGAFAEYVRVKSRYCWSIESLRNIYKGNEVFIAGSLVEPTCVAYNAVIERGGGIRPGDSVCILGSGPVGLAAVAILKRAGAVKVILSEEAAPRAEMGKRLGADYVINPKKEDFAEKVLEYTDGMGAKLFLEATGLPEVVLPGIEDVIWNGRELNSTVVIVARTDVKVPIAGEVYQVRRANIVGAQGHSGHGNFPRAINLMANGMDVTEIVTKRITLDEVPENIIKLQTCKDECKITAVLD